MFLIDIKYNNYVVIDIKSYVLKICSQGQEREQNPVSPTSRIKIYQGSTFKRIFISLSIIHFFTHNNFLYINIQNKIFIFNI
jgi:hypothetical protein